MDSDPLAAALAAGETPSPEMVAASKRKPALGRGTAVLCFLAIVTSLAGSSLLWMRLTVSGKLPLSAPASALRERARRILAARGYGEPVDSAYGFRYAGNEIRFWYRQAPRALRSRVILTYDQASSVVTPSSPEYGEGEVLVELDSTGQVEFLGVPAGGGDRGVGLGWLTAHPLLLGFSVVVLAASALEARRNIALGRAHGGSLRLCVGFFCLFVLHWLVLAHHVAGWWELYLLSVGLIWPAFIVGAFWTLYSAVEPNIRRAFPGALISWMRMVEGRWRDPLVASHILGGITVRMLTLPVLLLARIVAGAAPAKPPVEALAGAREALGYTLASIEMGSATGLITIAGLVVLRKAIGGRGWPAVALIVLGGLAAPSTLVGFFGGALNVGLGIWLVNRFGWLALLAGNLSLQVFLWTPVHAGPGYAVYWAPRLAITLAASGWALHSILRRRTL